MDYPANCATRLHDGVAVLGFDRVALPVSSDLDADNHAVDRAPTSTGKGFFEALEQMRRTHATGAR